VVGWRRIGVGAGVAELADARDLKSRDRKVVRVRFPAPAPLCIRALTVLMRCGDLQVGYFDQVEMTLGQVDSLRDLARTPRLEALYDKVDAVGVDRWTHRTIFSDYRETTVALERLGLRLTPTAGREFARQAELFVEVASEGV
jgi:hypothetical protein